MEIMICIHKTGQPQHGILFYTAVWHGMVFLVLHLCITQTLILLILTFAMRSYLYYLPMFSQMPLCRGVYVSPETKYSMLFL